MDDDLEAAAYRPPIDVKEGTIVRSTCEWTNQIAAHINPLSMFVNHSCAPNVRVVTDSIKGSTSIQLAALPDIRNGEELFQCYFSATYLSEGLEARRAQAKFWLAGDCQCDRCLEEEKQQLRDSDSVRTSVPLATAWDALSTTEKHNQVQEILATLGIDRSKAVVYTRLK